MKMTRKLIPALVMLLVSAIMLSTASFAWFASNSEVSATNMHVKVKSTTKYLQISTTSGSGFSSGVELTNDIATRGEIELVHAALQETGEAVTLAWQIGDSASSSEVGQIKQTLEITDEATQLAPYALLNTVYVRMSEDSTLGLSNVKIKPGSVTVTAADGSEIIDDIAPALRLLIVHKDAEGDIVGAQMWSNRDKNITTYNLGDIDYLIPTVAASSTEYALNIYVFYDGEDESAITDNDNNIQELVVGFSLIGG